MKRPRTAFSIRDAGCSAWKERKANLPTTNPNVARNVSIQFYMRYQINLPELLLQNRSQLRC